MQRITQRSLADNTYGNMQAALARSSQLQEQLSSGKKISRPSDSPAGTTSALQLRSELRANDQYLRNASSGVSWLDTADTALQQASTALQRSRVLAVQGGSGALNQVGRNAIATELAGIRESLTALANTQYLGRPVFGGTTATGTAFNADGTYAGDGGTVERRVGPGASVRVDVDGVAAFGSGPGSVFAVLDDMVATLRAGGPSTASINDVDVSLERLLGQLSDVGARTVRLENVKSRADEAAITLRGEQSLVEYIDLPATILEMKLQETAYQASLSAAARVLQPSLLDFLR